MFKKHLLKLLLLILIFNIQNIGFSNAFFNDKEVVSGNTFTAGCWAGPEVPVLTYPENNYLSGSHSAWNAVPHMDWKDSEAVCPGSGSVQYLYELYREYKDGNLSNLAYRSGWLPTSMINAPGTPEGDYWWRVKAKDSNGNESEWSEVWKLTVDRTPPVVKITSLEDGASVSGKVQILGTVTDKHPHHYWLAIYNSSGTQVAGPGTVNEDKSFVKEPIYEWDTTSLPNGSYTIKLEARDAADNKQPYEMPVTSYPEDKNDSVDWITVTVHNEPPAEDTPEIVINEIRWGGSTKHVQDEWIELRNMTDRDINLNGWKILGAGSSFHDLTLQGTIPAGGYFLIARYATDQDKAAIRDTIDADPAGNSMHIGPQVGQLILVDSSNSEVDRIPLPGDDNEWAAGNGNDEEETTSSLSDEPITDDQTLNQTIGDSSTNQQSQDETIPQTELLFTPELPELDENINEKADEPESIASENEDENKNEEPQEEPVLEGSKEPEESENEDEAKEDSETEEEPDRDEPEPNEQAVVKEEDEDEEEDEGDENKDSENEEESEKDNEIEDSEEEVQNDEE